MSFTASDFASWVFNSVIGSQRVYPIAQDPYGFGGEQRPGWEVERMRLGELSHYEIEEMRRNHFPFGWRVDDKKLWSVDYCDTGENSEIFESSVLLNRTDNRKLRGKPDLVFANNDNGHIVIIERKTTRKSIEELRQAIRDPKTWPNCQAQLWSYAHLDRYANSQRISLILQTWHMNKRGYHEMGDTTPPREFERGNESDRENLRRFEAYGGFRVS